MKRIGVLTGGGDSAGMNPALRAVVRTAWQHGAEVVGIKRGWLGLAEGTYEIMTPGSVRGIIGKGGTVLRTFRYPEFATDEGAITVGRSSACPPPSTTTFPALTSASVSTPP